MGYSMLDGLHKLDLTLLEALLVYTIKLVGGSYHLPSHSL